MMRYIVFYYSGRWHIAKKHTNGAYYSMAESDQKEDALEIVRMLNMVEDMT
jgi:hypothetical protein